MSSPYSRHTDTVLCKNDKKIYVSVDKVYVELYIL